MRFVSVKFNNYYRSYTFKTNLSLKEGRVYKIAADGFRYGAPVMVEKYLENPPEGILLKEIDEANEVEEEHEDVASS